MPSPTTPKKGSGARPAVRASGNGSNEMGVATTGTSGEEVVEEVAEGGEDGEERKALILVLNFIIKKFVFQNKFKK